MKKAQVLILLSILITMKDCKYTGGYDIVKGSKAIKEIKEDVTRYATLGVFYTFASISDFTCPSSASANVFTEVEPNNTYKYATKFDFPTEKQSVRIQGTITTGNSDSDILYMIVPSDTTYTKIYFRNIGKGLCFIDINSDGSELNNDSTSPNPEVTKSWLIRSEVNSESIQPSDYVFFFVLVQRMGQVLT